MNRDAMLERIRAFEGAWDLVIVGGGATGVGTALDAASRGYRTLLLEQSDFGKGTSSSQHEADPRRRALPAAGQHPPRHGGAEGARDPPQERAAPRPRPGVRRPELRVVGGAVLRDRHERLRRAGREVRLRAECQHLQGGGRGAHPEHRDARACEGGVVYHDGQFDDSRLLINLVRDGGGAGRRPRELRPGHGPA